MVTPFDARGARRRGRDRAAHAPPRRPRLRRRWSSAAPPARRPRWTTRSTCGSIELAVGEMRGHLPGRSPASAPTTPATRSSSPSGRPRSAPDALLSVNPYYNRPSRARDRRPLPRGRRARPSCRSCSTTSRSGRARTCPTSCWPSSASSTTSTAVKQANHANLARIDGLSVYAGNDDMLADVLELGEPGGILTGSHLFGEEMRRMVDEPEHRREIDDSLARRLPRPRDRARRLLDQGGAQHDRRARRARRGFPTSSSTSPSSRWSAVMLERHGLLGARGVSGTLRVLPLGGLGEIGKNMTVRRVRGAGSSSSTPACASRPPTCSGSTSCCPTSPTCASGPRTSRRSSSPTATRITSARCRGCCASCARLGGERARPSTAAR